MSTTVYNRHDFSVTLRKRIALPTAWKDILEVKISDIRTFVRGALTTEVSAAALTRGSAYSYGSYVLAQDTGTISSSYVVPILVDRADLAQQSYIDQMNLADLEGQKLNEAVESLLYANHASWMDFGATDLVDGADDDTTKIELSASNIDNVIRQVKRKIRENNGVELAAQNGYFFIWTASEFAMLEEFAQANGFTLADLALKNGIPVERAFNYMGADHYLTTQPTAYHRFAGIKKMGTIGILRSTYGQPVFIDDPGNISGLGIVTRIDYGWDFQSSTTYYKEFMIDMNTTV
jgi:hypothetical protein